MEHLLSPDSSDAYNVFGEPELFPRVGDQYQVEIPPLMTELEYCLYMKNPFEVELFPGVPFDFLMGLPIPITWINKEVGYVKHEKQELLGASNGTLNKNRLLESDGTKATKISLKVEESSLKVEPPEIGLENGIGIGDSTNLALDQEMKRKMHKYVGERYCLVPGSFVGSWSDIEEASFLLGLYVFGKNLVQVKRFIDSKKMGDLLSFYYGKFFRSDEYRRWSDCRKMRSRRCAYGQRIFTRSRQQELLSRLSQNVSEECQNNLVEGRDYFDSVTDVLSKVASEPGLLELDTETNESNRIKEENGRTSETKLEQNDLSDRKLHCYLQSQTPNHSTDLMKFTVVDTSLEDGKLFRVRELRTLPLEDSTKTTFRSHSEGNDEDSSDVSSEDSDSMDTVLFDLKDKNVSNSKKSASIFQTGSKHRGVPISNSYSGDAYFKNTKDFTKICDYKKPIESLKCCKRLKEDNLTSLAPVTKRHRRLLSCTRSEVSHGILGFSASQNFSSSETTDSSENNLHGMKKRVLSTISPKGIFCNTNFGGEASYEKPKQWPLIDLNLPQVPPDFETVEASTIELQQPESSTAPKPSVDVTCTEPNGSRRQSTRNRPPTARALEALANGFLTTVPRRRNKESSSREASRSRPRRAHGGMVATERFGNGFVSPLTGEVGNGVCDRKSDMYSKFQVLSEGNAVKVPEP
ncbi:hypothetical protein Acr_20g0007890 [Actinidia rufa]|uniref:DUF7952 domain-containing protein n=1 Tax=Actinidia rufa TaxID=165716 RepID=A0A7J0GDZ4_9ERIC|nr:hypothetical protein Acr_20g0007890 [Actinidia rufa]